jgi:general secretion pathway protein K
MKKLRRPKSKVFSERGVAMLLVIIGIAVMSLVANEVRYNSVVELRLATNQRDELRAHFLARSGIGITRLMLKFQKQLDGIQIPNMGGLLQQLTSALNPGGAPPPGGAPGSPPGAGAPTSMSIQLWRMVKVDCHMLSQMVPEFDEKGRKIEVKTTNKKFDFDAENPELAKEQGNKKFGTFTGCFETKITNEEERINVANLDAPQLTLLPVMGSLISMLGDKKYEFLFEKEDSNRIKVVPTDVIIAMRDWIDEDETGSQLNFSGQGDPIQKGFSDENGNYYKYNPVYRAKNGRFDSLDELYFIHGVNDKFMAAFKDRLTVYPDLNSKININSDDPIILELAIRAVSDPLRKDPRLMDPIFIDTLIQKIRAARVFALFGMSALDFVNIVAASGVPVNSSILNNIQNQRFIGDKSTTFRVSVTGSAGDVSRTISTVIRIDDGLGKLLYWREE